MAFFHGGYELFLIFGAFFVILAAALFGAAKLADFLSKKNK